jgi:hypothetical protein
VRFTLRHSYDATVVAKPKQREWVLLAYRMPREPSTPRIAVWRRLKRLGVAQLLDGLVGLPLTSKNQESLEWVAQSVTDGGGEATVWMGRPSSRVDEARLVASLRNQMAAEYRDLVRDAERVGRSTSGRRRSVQRLQRELRRLAQRDHFPPSEADEARRVVAELANGIEARS